MVTAKRSVSHIRTTHFVFGSAFEIFLAKNRDWPVLSGARIDPTETYMHAQVKASRGSLTEQLIKAHDSVDDIKRKLEALSPRDLRRSKLQTVLRADQNKVASIAHRLARLV